MNQAVSTTEVVWAIGGVDSLALAGIAADMRAVAVSGAHCATIVSCVTAQNSQRLIACEATPISLMEQQWLALSQQTTPAVVKVGLLANQAQVVWLANKLEGLRQQVASIRVIYDPVVKASADRSDQDVEILHGIVNHLLPQVDLLTPNADEACALLAIQNEKLTDGAIDDPKVLVRQLSDHFKVNVLLKGGHLTPVKEQGVVLALDYYSGLEPTQHQRFRSEPTAEFALGLPWCHNINSRGTGCTLASLIAGLVAKQYTFCDAIVIAKAVLGQALTQSQSLGSDRGGLLSLTLPTSFEQLPLLLTDTNLVSLENEFASCPDKLGLYPVVADCQWLERLLKLGVKTIQIRAKDFADADIEPQIVKAVALGQQYNARVFINDYWRLAIKHGAYGVHLGQEDMVEANLIAIKQAGLRLGLSTHGVYEALVANQLAPSYIALGHIYATQTKDMPSRPQGLEKLALQVELLKTQRALVAIGGISADRVDDILSSGIGSVALVTAITLAEDVAGTTEQLLELVGAGESLVEASVCEDEHG
ncbi:thiamine phosphate synthase [Psychrobium sp. 1_MG-2023]|uniref:thiamine phosphate synthase n=1 Tax=Psychrobium sp. 1_MG-2023 TaxID=3062624 RepID=UPI000C34B708|nr:thiamine phosphate synthase [Psychrobium sp. 1_MG-2023]MDP2560167.1 thiamine phosphate synthase [Psychrobium sp. 1_MG-2023]PKF56978.1 thiamine phosphate synthase [Alteromonadales bacterium alter-6D02]